MISVLLLVGCVPMQRPHALTQEHTATTSAIGPKEILYLAHTLTATPAKLATMWHLAKADRSPAGQLHQALIESIQGSTFYDPSAAASKLRMLRSGRFGAMLAAVAKVRLAQMSRSGQCEQKMRKIVNIEKKLDKSPP